MSNAFPANAVATSVDRRTAMGSFVAFGAALVAPLTANAAPQDRGTGDPVFAAIERHKASLARFTDTCSLVDEVAAEQQGRTITDADEAEWEVANKEEGQEFLALISTAPLTRAGARALIVYVSSLDDLEGVEGAAPTFLATLLRSPLIAEEA